MQCAYNLPQIARAHKFHTILYQTTNTVPVHVMSVASQYIKLPNHSGIFLSITRMLETPTTVCFCYQECPPAINGSKAGRIPCWVQTWRL